MKKIIIQTIPHKKQRYPTLGDYWETNKTIEFRVSQSDEKAEMLILIHELVEAFLTKVRKIKWEDIDNFDIQLDKINPELEPGDQKEAPYYKEHQIATIIERLLCFEMGLSWEEYEHLIDQKV